MSDGGPVYSRQEIYQHLRSIPFGALSTVTDGTVNSRFMLFSCDESLSRFYLLTNKLTAKVDEVKRSSEVSLAVLMPAEDIEDFAETVIRGEAMVLDQFDDQSVQEGLSLLGSKSPELKGLKDGGSLGDYVVLKVEPRELVFRVYRDVVANHPKTILEFN